jgi:hypothetical protein
MTPAAFEESLRALLRRQPFQPFLVELINGETFTVDRSDAVALGGGAAGFIAEKGDIYFFDYRNVRRLGDTMIEPSA